MYYHSMKKYALVACGLALLVGDVRAEETTVVETPVAGSAKKAGSTTKEVKPQMLKLADGKLLLPVPGEWKSVKPKSRIIQHEFSIVAAKSDDTPGRMTIMAAGGGVEANIARWVGQFKSPDGKPLGADNAKTGAKKVDKKKVGDLEVHVVDLTGDFQDSPRGPFGPKVNRPGYRMLAAIIPLKQGGTWFIKTYGPKATMKANEKSFAKMIEGMKHTP